MWAESEMVKLFGNGFCNYVASPIDMPATMTARGSVYSYVTRFRQ